MKKYIKILGIGISIFAGALNNLYHFSEYKNMNN